MAKLREFTKRLRSLETTKRYSDAPTIEVDDDEIISAMDEEDYPDEDLPKPPRPPGRPVSD